MIKVLLAWEIGGGQGHMYLLECIAQRLLKYGIETIFALKSSHIKGARFSGKVLQAPQAVLKFLDDIGDNNAYFLTDIFYMFGFSSELTLSFHLQAWRNLITLVKPDLIIADFAPVLVLAARGKVPTIVVGNGFSIPPLDGDFPALRPLPIPVTAIDRQNLVKEVVERVTRFDLPLANLLNGDRSFIFSIPELDPYRNVRKNATYLGIHSAPFPLNLGDETGAAWAYLQEDWEHYSLLIDTLAPTCKFEDLKTVLNGKSLAIHHASFGTSISCLLAGIPQLVFPQDLEKSHTARDLVELGVAISLPETFTQTDLVTAISHVPQLTKTARQQAQNFANWNDNFVDRLIQVCLQYLP